MDAPLELQRLRATPRLFQVDAFASDGEITHILAATDGTKLAADRIATKHDFTGFSCELPIAGDAILESLRDRIHQVCGFRSDYAPTFRFRRYHSGEHHPPHRDVYEIGGARLIATALLYLAAPETGGETWFQRADPPIRVAPRKGRLVLWFNHLPDGAEDPAAEHESLTVGAGEKITVTLFLYASLAAAAASVSPGKIDRPARSGEGLRFHCVDDGVPEETPRLLRSACERRGVAFFSVETRDFDYPSARQLGPGDLLYRPAVSMAAMRVEQFLFAPGATTFHRNPRNLFYDCVNPSLLFERAGLPIPRTIYRATRDRALLRRAVEHLGGFPIVAKWLGGQGGVGVLRVDSFPSLFSLIDHATRGSGLPLLMRYIPDAVQHRLIVIGDRVVAGYRGQTARDDFRSYSGDEPADYLAPIDPAMAAIAIRASQVLEVETVGVDLLRATDGSIYLLEANFPCYFPQAQVVTGCDIAGAMLDHLIAKSRAAA
jgi:hypothetical protein